MFIHGHSELIKHKCLICHDKLHKEETCGLINYAPNQLNIAMKLNHGIS